MFYGAYIYIFGIHFVLTAYVASFAIAAGFGTWLFYVQHIFPDTSFSPNNGWNHIDTAIKASSFYKLPSILNWFTLNIGYHHIHHLFPKIPGYKLKNCYDENTILQNAKTYTLRDTIKLAKLKLYDTKNNRAINWDEYNHFGNTI